MDIDAKNHTKWQNKIAHALWPYNWLPRTQVRAAIVACAFLTAHFSLAYAPYATAYFKLDSVWASGPGVLIRMMPLLALMAITAIFFGLSMRRLVLLFRNEPAMLVVIFLAMVGIPVLFSVASKDVLEIANEKWDEFKGLKIWYTAWAATAAFGLKPIFDEIFDRLHPKDSLPAISETENPNTDSDNHSMIRQGFRSFANRFFQNADNREG